MPAPERQRLRSESRYRTFRLQSSALAEYQPSGLIALAGIQLPDEGQRRLSFIDAVDMASLRTAARKTLHHTQSRCTAFSPRERTLIFWAYSTHPNQCFSSVSLSLTFCNTCAKSLWAHSSEHTWP